LARSGATVRRLLTKEQLIYLQLESEGLRLLPVGTRREIADSTQRSPKTEKLPVANGTALLIEIGTARRKVENQLKHLAQIEAMVVSDPEIMGGTPVFNGVPMALRAAKSDEDAGRRTVARAFSRPCRHSCRHAFDRVFKGTRIPVDLVADVLAQGATVKEILEGYPTLNKEKIAIAPSCMRSFPRRGRPNRRPWQGCKTRGRESFPLGTLLGSA
jgi:uncharacterized protein (DUF433 family)